jgi:hypothetical protein
MAFVFITAMHQMIAQIVVLEQKAIGQHWNMMNAMYVFKDFL